MRNFLRLAFAWALLLSLVPQHSLAQYTPTGVTSTGKITAKVLDAEGEQVRGARLLAYHLSSEQLFTSEPTEKNGECRIEGLPYGYFDLAIETPDGLFVANRVINLAPTGTAAVILTVVPYQPSAAQGARKHPGSDQEPLGQAELSRKPKGREFWRSPKGVAIIAGIGGAALLAIAAGSDSESISTQF
jgi:hypothetical protein